MNLNENSSNVKYAAIFLSGSGTNAIALLRDIHNDPASPWRASVLVTDKPETSRAREIAKEFSLPLVEHDIDAFYKAEGLDKVTIRTEEGMRIREKWTDVLREKLKGYTIDFGIHAGFTTLCNITNDYPCLNIHPGDLTVIENGVPLFAGLHIVPTETAILRGFSAIRSSVIVAVRVETGGAGMDEGPVLGVSDFLPLDLQGHTLEELQAVKDARAGKKPAEYKNDLLRQIATANVDRLKECGDWKVFPRVVRDFANGHFSFSPLQYKGQEIITVSYEDGKDPKPILK